MTRPVVVLDTNIVLDLFVFEDEQVGRLRLAIEAGELRWLACGVMRDELERVLDYPQVVSRLDRRALRADAVLAAFDRCVELVNRPVKMAFTCKDPDDQVFLDLAAAHGATLISKDRAVLAMRGRMERVGARVARAWRA